MTDNDLRLAAYLDDQSQVGRYFGPDRTIRDNRIATDHFSPRAMLFAVPMAAALWVAGALIGYAYL